MSRKNIARSSAMISILSVVSKVMGSVRVMMINWEFGQGAETDAFNGAIKLTSIIMNIVGAAILTVMVPVLTHVKQRHGNRGKLKFFNNVSNIVACMALGLMVLTYVFAPQLVAFMFNGFDPAKQELTVKLTRMGLPIIMALGLMNLATGYLHSYNIYGPYAVMGIPFNLTYFLYLFFAPPTIEGLMVASVIAYFVQWLVQVPAIHKTGYRWQPTMDLEDPYVHRALRLVIPTAIGQAAQQINVVIDQALASGLPDGTISALDNASKLNDAIISVFITGVTTVIFPLLSEAFEKGDEDATYSIVDRGVGFVLLITVPATVGLVLLSEDIVTLLFEHNNFTAEDTVITASALACYALGLMASGFRHLITKVYYSFNDTRTPMKNGFLSVGLDIILNISLVGPLGHIGLAVSTSISNTITTGILTWQLRDRLPELDIKGYIVEFAKVLASALVMGLAVYLVNTRLTSMGMSLVVNLAACIAIAVVVYAVMVIVTQTKSSKVVLAGIKERMN